MAKNKKNVYVCSRVHKTVTVDVDDGVTPAQIQCTRAGCNQMARSSYYQVEQQGLVATHEFYRPKSMTGLTDTEIAYVKNGGLLMRKI